MPDCCPECDAPIRTEGGCWICVDCGLSPCHGGLP